MIIEDKLGDHGDALYAELIKTHDDLSLEQSHALNARLILIFMNEIEDPARIIALLKEARKTTLD